MSADILMVFVKEPRPGAVKTRLARAIGDEAAAALYRAIAEEEIRRTAPVAGEYERLFFYAPDASREAIEAWLPGETCLPQAGADLGARMAAAFDEAFGRGARRAAIIGTDVPSCSRGHVLDALRALDAHDLALGPTHDGGYYLMALDRPRPQLFAGLPWSTPSVLPMTVERAGLLGLSVRLLDALHDLDTLEDLRAQRDLLRGLLAEEPALARLLG